MKLLHSLFGTLFLPMLVVSRPSSFVPKDEIAAVGGQLEVDHQQQNKNLRGHRRLDSSLENGLTLWDDCIPDSCPNVRDMIADGKLASFEIQKSEKQKCLCR